MDWMQVLFIFFSNAALILWFRSESRSDWRHMDNKLDAYMKGIREDMNNFNEKLLEIDKNFHERLLKIEMERKK